MTDPKPVDEAATVDFTDPNTPHDRVLVVGDTKFYVNSEAMENYEVLAQYSYRFLADPAFSLCEEFILDNLALSDYIVPLKMAFKYDWTEIKNEAVERLTSESENVCRCGRICTKCYKLGIDKGTSFVLTKSSMLVKMNERIVELPSEIQCYILKTLMERLKKM